MTVSYIGRRPFNKSTKKICSRFEQIVIIAQVQQKISFG